MVHDDGPVGLDGLKVKFDDERAVSDGGVALVATLAERLGLEALAGKLVRLRREQPGAANAGRKVMALLYAMVLGADSIDDADVLRAGRTDRLLGGWVPAPSTLGTFLRAFTFGHVRQLDKLLGQALERAWRAGALERLTQQLVELAYVPEGERPQEGAERGGRRNPAAEQPVRATGAQHVCIVDRVGAEHHRVKERHHLATGVGGTRLLAPQPHQLAGQRLESESLGERRDQRHAAVGNRPLVVKLDLQSVQSDRPVIVHHQGDLLNSGRGCSNQPLSSPFRRSFFVQGRMESVDSGLDKPVHGGEYDGPV